MNLFKFKDRVISTDDFITALRPHVTPGDVLYVEIDTMAFGKLFDFTIKRQDFFAEFMRIFTQLVGPDGHIIVPSFSYSWGADKEQKLFDVNNTPSAVGAFSEYFRTQVACARTADPMFSCLVYGPKQQQWCDTGHSSFGVNSIFEKLHQANAKMVSFGLKQYDPTIVHYIEQLFDREVQPIGYRTEVEFSGALIDAKGQASQGSHYAFMRALDSHDEFTEQRMVHDLQQQQQLVQVTLGGGQICLSDANAVVATVLQGMKQNVRYLVQ